MKGRINPSMILVVGNINFDILFPLDHLPGPHEKMTCDNAVTGFGGSAANTAYWLARLKAGVTLAGAVGSDPMGDAHLSTLKASGVDIGGVDRVGGNTGMAIIFSLGREKRMVRAPGTNVMGAVHPELVTGKGSEGGGGCELVYLSGADTKTLAGYAELARKNRIPVICGQNAAREPEVAGLADGFILNSDEVREITGLANPAEGIQALDSSLAAVTLPTGGCLVSEGIFVHEVPAPELEPVDRTGGGDAFAAGFLAALAEGHSVEECGRRGNILAAEVIMGVGARPEITIPDGMAIRK